MYYVEVPVVAVVVVVVVRVKVRDMGSEIGLELVKAMNT